MNSKERLLALLNLLWLHTDEEHPMTTSEIVAYFNEQGVVTYRKTVKEDINILIDFGVDIVAVKSTQTSYFCATRVFELPELKLLIDAVESSKFITEKKSAELVGKLTGFSSRHQTAELHRNLFVSGRIKPQNENIYYTIDILHRAIQEQVKISFRYYEYDYRKQKVWKHGGFIYCFSPYALFWNEDKYYVIGYSDKHKKIIKFRVDRMEIPSLLTESAFPVPLDFDAAEYGVKIFDMFDGTETNVELQCDNSLIKTIVDRFGEDITVYPLDASSFKTCVTVSVSPTFFSWVFQFGGKVKILLPKQIAAEYKSMLTDTLKNL